MTAHTSTHRRPRAAPGLIQRLAVARRCVEAAHCDLLRVRRERLEDQASEQDEARAGESGREAVGWNALLGRTLWDGGKYV